MKKITTPPETPAIPDSQPPVFVSHRERSKFGPMEIPPRVFLGLGDREVTYTPDQASKLGTTLIRESHAAVGQKPKRGRANRQDYLNFFDDLTRRATIRRIR